MSDPYPTTPEPVVIPGQDPIEPTPPQEAPQTDLPPEVAPAESPMERPDLTPSPDQEGGRPVD